MAKYTDAKMFEPNVEMDSDISVLVYADTDDIARDLFDKLGIKAETAMIRGVWFKDYIESHPEYLVAVKQRTRELLGPAPSIITRENVFTPDVELDARMFALTAGSKETFKERAIGAGFTDVELGSALKDLADLLGKAIGSQYTFATEQDKDGKISLAGLSKDELDADDKKGLEDLNLKPTLENYKFIQELAESAVNKTDLAKPYLAKGAVEIDELDIAPGVKTVAVKFHKTKLAEMVNKPSQHCQA